MGLLWERESCRIFLDRIADEASRASYLTMLQAAVAKAGLKAQKGWTIVFTELDLERLPRHTTFSPVRSSQLVATLLVPGLAGRIVCRLLMCGQRIVSCVCRVCRVASSHAACPCMAWSRPRLAAHPPQLATYR